MVLRCFRDGGRVPRAGQSGAARVSERETAKPNSLRVFPLNRCLCNDVKSHPPTERLRLNDHDNPAQRLPDRAALLCIDRPCRARDPRWRPAQLLEASIRDCSSALSRARDQGRAARTVTIYSLDGVRYDPAVLNRARVSARASLPFLAGDQSKECLIESGARRCDQHRRAPTTANLTKRYDHGYQG